MNMNEMRAILNENKELLSKKLNRKVEAFVEYANETHPIVRILSGEERLKSKLMIEMSKDERFNVTGQDISDEFVIDEGLLFVDYIVIISSALRVAPINLKNYLETVRIHSKRCFIVIDNWAMIPKTEENIIKIKEEITKDYPMVDIFNCFMISETGGNGFSSLSNASEQIGERISSLYNETHGNQINSIYKYLLNEIDTEMVEVSKKASKSQSILEEMRNSLAGMEKANRIKFDNIRDVFNNYSLNLLDDLDLVSIDECIKEDEDFTSYNNVRTYVNSEYVDKVKQVFIRRNEIVLKEYQMRLKKFRENLLTEMKVFLNKVEKIELCDERLLDVMSEKSNEIATVDDIISNISTIVENGLSDLLKKISSISKRSFFEEAGTDENILEKLKKIAQQKAQEAIDEEEERIKREKIIRMQLNKSMKNVNLMVFEETDRFIENMKMSILALSEEVVAVYYYQIEKNLLEMESQIEKRYCSR